MSLIYWDIANSVELCQMCSTPTTSGDRARFGNVCRFCAATLPEDTESIIDDLSESEKTQRPPVVRP